MAYEQSLIQKKQRGRKSSQSDTEELAMQKAKNEIEKAAFMYAGEIEKLNKLFRDGYGDTTCLN